MWQGLLSPRMGTAVEQASTGKRHSGELLALSCSMIKGSSKVPPNHLPNLWGRWSPKWNQSNSISVLGFASNHNTSVLFGLSFSLSGSSPSLSLNIGWALSPQGILMERESWVSSAYKYHHNADLWMISSSSFMEALKSFRDKLILKFHKLILTGVNLMICGKLGCLCGHLHRRIGKTWEWDILNINCSIINLPLGPW